MTEINTFSAAIDQVVTVTGRIDRKPSIISYLRSTVREIQSLDKFSKDLTEDQLTATADPYIWNYPDNFRRVIHVEYPSLVDAHGKKIVPDYVPPGKKQAKLSTPYYYYDGPGYYVFAGMGGNNPGDNPLINLAYLSYLLPIAYFQDIAIRPATYSLETNTWSYLTAVTDTEKEAARALVTNWVLFNWFDMCVEGALAKLWKMLKR